MFLYFEVMIVFYYLELKFNVNIIYVFLNYFYMLLLVFFRLSKFFFKKWGRGGGERFNNLKEKLYWVN